MVRYASPTGYQASSKSWRLFCFTATGATSNKILTTGNLIAQTIVNLITTSLTNQNNKS